LDVVDRVEEGEGGVDVVGDVDADDAVGGCGTEQRVESGPGSHDSWRVRTGLGAGGEQGGDEDSAGGVQAADSDEPHSDRW
jgi:hypothetical protein